METKIMYIPNGMVKIMSLFQDKNQKIFMILKVKLNFIIRGWKKFKLMAPMDLNSILLSKKMKLCRYISYNLEG